MSASAYECVRFTVSLQSPGPYPVREEGRGSVRSLTQMSDSPKDRSKPSVSESARRLQTRSSDCGSYVFVGACIADNALIVLAQLALSERRDVLVLSALIDMCTHSVDESDFHFNRSAPFGSNQNCRCAKPSPKSARFWS